MYNIVAYLKCIDLVPELVWVLPGHLLAGDLSLHLLQPLVEALEVLRGLPVFLLHRLLKFQ